MMFSKITTKTIKTLEYPINILITQIKQNECTKLKDNILLYKLLSKAPKCFDRVFEYPWVLKNIDIKEGRLLDVGSTVGNMLKELIPENIEIHTINTEKKESNNKTIQYGIRDVLPINKLYNKNRINVLTKDFRIIKEEYLKYNSKYSLWLNSSEQEAGKTDWLKDRWYSLAFFILEK